MGSGEALSAPQKGPSCHPGPRAVPLAPIRPSESHKAPTGEWPRVPWVGEPPKQSSACWLVTGMQQASGPRSGGLWRAVPGRQGFGEAPAGNPPLPLGSLRAEGPGAQLLWRHSRVRAAKSHPETRRAMRKGAQATHPGKGPPRAVPAPPRLPGRRRWCTPGTGREKALVDSVGHSEGAQPSWPCLHSHRAVRADEATHILHDPQHPQPHLLAEGQFPLHVPN